MSLDALKRVNDELYATFRHEATEDIGCIIYVFDRSEDGQGTGFSTKNCDPGDALVAIQRIHQKFGV